MRTTGRPITGVDYQRIEHGPAPRILTAVRTSLIERHDAELRHEVRLGLTQHRLLPLRPPRTDLFTESELNAIAEVLATLGSKSGRELTEMSHAEPMWNLVDEGETIPLETAFLRHGRVTERIAQRARELASHHQSRS